MAPKAERRRKLFHRLDGWIVRRIRSQRFRCRRNEVGSLVVMTPPPQHGVRFLDQLPGPERHASPGKRAYLIHETADRFLPRDSVQFPRLSTTANLARRQPELLAALDLV